MDALLAALGFVAGAASAYVVTTLYGCRGRCWYARKAQREAAVLERTCEALRRQVAELRRGRR